MKPQIKVIITLVVVLVLVGGFYFTSKAISSITGKNIQEVAESKSTDSGLDEFAKCLSEKGVKLYVREGCPYCSQQKADFGSSLENLNIIECTEQLEVCKEKELKGVPAWEIDGEINYGKRSLENIAELSGCSL